MQLLIMGAPGAGKGTQAAKLVAKYKIIHVSTGDIFRSLDERTELGQQARRFMEVGKLIPDDLTNRLVEDRLQCSDCMDNGWILDGYPRNLEQASNLKVVSRMIRRPLTKVLNIHVPSEILIERAVGRRICKNCGATYHVKFNAPKVADVCDSCGGELYQRADDNADTMKRRLSVYEKNTRPLIDYYKQEGLYAEVDGTQPIDKVTEDLFAILDALK